MSIFFYRFISQIVKRSIYSLKVFNTMANCSKEEKQKLIADIKSRMQTIQYKAMRSVDDLRKGMEFEINSLSETLKSVVNSEVFRRVCTTGNPENAPDRKINQS